MEIGDIAIPDRQSVREGRWLHCGTGRYDFAVVGSVNPFILVSASGDMVWSCTWKPEELTYLCQAPADVLERVMARIEADKERDSIESEAGDE